MDNEAIKKMLNTVVHTRIWNIVRPDADSELIEAISQFYWDYLRCIHGKREEHVDDLINCYDKIIKLCKHYGFEIAD